MRLHTNKLTWIDVFGALATAKNKGLVAQHIHFEESDEKGSRSHARAFEVQLGTYTKLAGDKRRYKNTGNGGASNVYAATYDEWGHFIAELFKLDPEMTFGNYKGVADFDAQTSFKYGD